MTGALTLIAAIVAVAIFAAAVLPAVLPLLVHIQSALPR